MFKQLVYFDADKILYPYADIVLDTLDACKEIRGLISFNDKFRCFEIRARLKDCSSSMEINPDVLDRWSYFACATTSNSCNIKKIGKQKVLSWKDYLKLTKGMTTSGKCKILRSYRDTESLGLIVELEYMS